MTMLVLLKLPLRYDKDINDNVVVIIAACGRRRGKDDGKRGSADDVEAETMMTETTATMKKMRQR